LDTYFADFFGHGIAICDEPTHRVRIYTCV
jgi:hypothetical protein